ncbi:MAG: glycosyltransferase family 9 protein [Candidatus Eisenbacteria sp.]|nr:glycosyltransferase family 9 protein [Candidatus Eisenbacteria bacterium]
MKFLKWLGQGTKVPAFKFLKWLEHGMKRPAFMLLKIFLSKGRAGAVASDPLRLTRVLFIRPQKIGDLVVALPVFDALKAAGAHVAIDVLVSPRSLGILKRDPRFDRVFIYRKRTARDVREILAIRRRHYDCVVDMIDGDSLTGLLLSQLCAAGRPRIGSNKQAHAAYYDAVTVERDASGAQGHVVVAAEDGAGVDRALEDRAAEDGAGVDRASEDRAATDRMAGHSIERGLNLLDLLGIDGTAAVRYASPYIEQAAWGKIDRSFPESRTGSTAMRIGCNLSAGNPTRVWAVARARELIARILSFLPESRIILLTAPGDRERGREAKADFDDRVITASPGLTITEVAALISRLDVLISPDTSLVHIARSFEVPVVGMYPRRAWNLARWRPYGQTGGIVISGNDENIFDITAEQVFAVFQELIATRTAGSL